ncbi:MAG: hypothetical protein GF331_05285 [Chitinivibrionales bacterium]|nr:hypothetical protein [Chitinivibrionales bacterium]
MPPCDSPTSAMRMLARSPSHSSKNTSAPPCGWATAQGVPRYEFPWASVRVVTGISSLAGVVLRWAQMRGIAVPDTHALIALGEYPALTHAGISSMYIDYERIGYVLAHAVIGDVPPPKSPRGFLRVGGTFVERDTTA